MNINLRFRLTVETDTGYKVVQHLEGIALTKDDLPFRDENGRWAFASDGPSLLTAIEATMLRIGASFRGQVLEWALQQSELDESRKDCARIQKEIP